MKIEELRSMCEEAEKNNFAYFTLTMPRPKHGCSGYSIRTPFGLSEIACVQADKVVFFASVLKVKRFLHKRLESK